MNKFYYYLLIFFNLALGIGNTEAQAAAFRIPAPLAGASQSISLSGSTVLIKGSTQQVNQVWVNGRQVPVGKDGSFTGDLIIPIGPNEILIEVRDPSNKISQYKKTILAKEQHFFLVGIADGTVNFVDASQGHFLKRDNQTFKDGTHTRGKISYYLAGKVKGKYLIKSSLDTDKATQEKLFTSIDPDKYYPIYGDNSTVVYDVNSQGKFYLLVEWDKSGLVVGNFQTQIGDEDSKLSSYQRTLYGGKLHLETPGKTIYGDTRSKGTAFIAEANQKSAHNELLATGGSLYYLRHRNIVEGSEQIRLDVRDKRTGLVIQSIPQASLVDYEMKYDEGRVLFKKPVLNVAQTDTIITDGIQESHEVYVIVNYEYKSQEAFPIFSDDFDETSGGFRLSHQITDNIRIGGTYVQEEKDVENHTLGSIDATIKLGNFTKVNVEWAETRADAAINFVSYNGGYDFTAVDIANDTRGRAFRAEFNSSIGEFFGLGKEFLSVSGYWRTMDKNFSPSESLFESGTDKYGLELSHRLTDSDKLRFIYEDQKLDKAQGAFNLVAKNDLQASRVQNFIGQWQHDWNKWTFYTEYKAQSKKDSFSAIEDPGALSDTDSILAEKIEYHYSEDTTFFIGQQVGLDDSEDTLSSAGVSHRIFKDLTGHIRGEVGQDRNAVLAGLERQTDPHTTEYMNYILTGSATDGDSSATAFGSNTKISNSAELRRERQFVTSDTRGVYTADVMGLKNQFTPEFDLDLTYDRREEAVDNLKGSMPRDSVSTTLSYNKVDFLKAISKFEYRVDTGDDFLLLSDSQAEWKVTQDWHLFGEYEYSYGEDETRDIALSRIDKKQIGVAFRPVDFDWFNWLFKYTRLQDDRPRDLTSADGGFMAQKTDYHELATEFAVDLPWNFQAVEKVAYREEELTAVDPSNTIETPADFEAYLIVHRLNYHLTNRVDVAAEFRTLRMDGSDINTLEYGPLVEATYKLHKYFAIGAGYNFSSFKDDFTVLSKKKSEGFFIRVQGRY